MSVMYTCTSLTDMCCTHNSSFRSVSYHTAHAKRKCLASLSCCSFDFCCLLLQFSPFAFLHVPSGVIHFGLTVFHYHFLFAVFLICLPYMVLHVPFLMSVIFKENNSSLLQLSS